MVYMMCNCTAIGAEFGDVRPLDEARMRAMTVNGIQLLDLIDSNDAFLSKLASPTVGVITWSQRDHLKELVHSRDRNDKLLEFLKRRSVADFHKFTRVLSKYQAHLVPLLVTDGGEIFYCVSKMMSYLSHATFVSVARLLVSIVATLYYMATCLRLFATRRYAKCGIYGVVMSVCVCVCVWHTPVLYQNG